MTPPLRRTRMVPLPSRPNPAARTFVPATSIHVSPRLLVSSAFLGAGGEAERRGPYATVLVGRCLARLLDALGARAHPCRQPGDRRNASSDTGCLRVRETAPVYGTDARLPPACPWASHDYHEKGLSFRVIGGSGEVGVARVRQGPEFESRHPD